MLVISSEDPNLSKSVISKPFTSAELLGKFHYMTFGGDARIINLDLPPEKRGVSIALSALIYFPIHIKSRFLIDSKNLMNGAC